MSQSPNGKVEESQITKESGKEYPINYVTQAQDWAISPLLRFSQPLFPPKFCYLFLSPNPKIKIKANILEKIQTNMTNNKNLQNKTKTP